MVDFLDAPCDPAPGHATTACALTPRNLAAALTAYGALVALVHGGDGYLVVRDATDGQVTVWLLGARPGAPPFARPGPIGTAADWLAAWLPVAECVGWAPVRLRSSPEITASP